jgi:hypothetical protein
MDKPIQSGEKNDDQEGRRRGIAKRIGRALSRFRGERAAPEQPSEERNDEARLLLASAREPLNTSELAAGEIARAFVGINERLVRAKYPGELVDTRAAGSLHWDGSRASSTVSWSPSQTALSGLPDHRGIRQPYRSPMVDSQTGLKPKVNGVQVTRRTEVDIANPGHNSDRIDVELSSRQIDQDSIYTQRFTYASGVDGKPIYRAEEYRTQPDGQPATSPEAIEASQDVFATVAAMVKVMATDSADYQPSHTITHDQDD